MAMVRDLEDDRISRRWRWILLIFVGLLPFVAIGMFIASFDAEYFKPQIVAAVKQATGRDLVIHGRLHLTFSFRPTIAADRVSFANAPGGSRAEMATLERIEARIALLPLLQHQLEIDTLALVRPDVLLETDAQGRGNWRFSDATAPAPGGGAGRGAQAGGARNNFSVKSVRIDDGTLTWRDGRTGTASTIKLKQAEFTMESAAAPISVAMEAIWNGTRITTSGQVGSLNILQGQSAAAFPLRLILDSLDAKLSISGTIAAPLQGKGYQLKLEGNAPALAALAPLLPGVRLPPLRDVSFAVELADRGGAAPDVSALVVRAGPSDLAALAPGLQITRLEIAVPKLDQPARIAMEGNQDGTAVALLASIGAPGLLLGGGKPAAPVPVDMALSAAGARITVKGSMGDPAALAGVDVALRATVPDLAALGRLAGLGLPAWKDVTLQARLLSPQGGLGNGVVLKELALASAAMDAAGELAVGLRPRLAVQGNLTSRRIDLDALGGGGASAAAVPGQRGQANARGPRRVIPDDALPFAVLRSADGDVQWRIDELVRGGESTRNISFRAGLKDGKLKLEPFAAEPPAGKVTGSLNVDASRPEPAVALVLRAPALDIAKLYHAIGRDGEATNGTVELDVNLRGQGQSLQAIAATAEGHLGMAVVGGAVDNRVLSLGLFGDLLRGINQGDVLARRGTTQVRCFALRVDAKGGMGDVRALLLDSSTLFLEGSGGMNLRDETLALRMRAQPRLLGLGIALPVRVGGSFAAPRVALDPMSGVGGGAGAVGQTAQGTAETAAGGGGSGVGAVTGALGLANGGNAAALPDACAAQLAIARGGRTGTVPAALAAPESGQPRGQGNRGRPNVLQRLLPR